LSPIENLWEIVGEDLKKRGVQPSSKQDLFRQVLFSWQNIPTEIIHRLCDSMPKRCREVIAAKGYHINY
jgi:hypothetical protein